MASRKISKWIFLLIAWKRSEKLPGLIWWIYRIVVLNLYLLKRTFRREKTKERINFTLIIYIDLVKSIQRSIISFVIIAVLCIYSVFRLCFVLVSLLTLYTNRNFVNNTLVYMSSILIIFFCCTLGIITIIIFIINITRWNHN